MKSKTRKTLFVSIAVLSLGAWVLRGHHEITPQAPVENSKQKKSNNSKAQVLDQREDEQGPLTVAQLAPIVKKEAERVGRLDTEPEATKLRLEIISQNLSKESLNWLSDNALNSRATGDERFLSTFLLTLNPSSDSVEPLSKIAKSLVPKGEGLRVGMLERAIRSQAIEGLSLSKGTGTQHQRAVLTEISRLHPDHFLRDRANRALAYLENQTQQNLQAQDKAALEKAYLHAER